jgi:HK97 family phage portal protein
MNVTLKNVWSGLKGYLSRTSIATPDDQFLNWATGNSPTKSGVTVTESTALNFSAVFAAVRILAETVGMLPLGVYQKLKAGGSRHAEEHSLDPLIRLQPNDEMTSVEWREQQMASKCLWGNGYSQIIRDGAGRVRAMWPLQPSRMTVERKRGQLLYNYAQLSGPDRTFLRREIHHDRLFSLNGVTGMAPLSLHREAIALGLAAEEYSARLFGQGQLNSGFLEHPGALGDKAYDRLKETIDAEGGLLGAHKTRILEEGMKYQEIGIKPADAQMLATRQFQVEEIARIFRVPPHLLADLSKATFSNIEHQQLGFVVFSIMPWLVRWEQTMSRDLFSAADRSAGYYAKFKVNALLRGDMAARSEFYSKMRMNGAFNADMMLELEDMNPLPDGKGKAFWMPLNMLEVGAAVPEPKPVEPTENGRSETRARGAARLRLRKAYHQLFLEAATRIVKRETADIRKAAGKHLRTRSADGLTSWLEKFYADMPDIIRKQMFGVMMSYAEAQSDAVWTEHGDDMEFGPEMEEFVEKYLGAYSDRHIGSSLGQLKALLREGDPETLLEDVEQRLDEWDEKRGEKDARNETVQLAEAVALAALVFAGVTTFVWRATGGDPCPFCQSLDGKVVGKDKQFVSAGSDLKAGGNTMHVRGPKMNPPVHDGCDCQIFAE